ncbi:MAG: hypothetical protein VKN15_07060 [Cyanobacteriota bacterium]|nr:hypothetical protein [Cyanobacteriota bacterium]
MTTGQPFSPQAPQPPDRARRRRGLPLIPLILLLLALLDLRIDLQLLADHFTITSLSEAIRSHPLAIAVLLFTPSLWRHHRT